MTRVVIVDDHPIVREGLVAALGDDVVGVFESADAALRARVACDVVILDLELPGTSGLDAIAKFTAPVLVLTAYANDDDIERAIAEIAKGGTFLDPRIATRVVRRDRSQRLTARERQVLKLVANGRSNKEIASALKITERTVKFHVTAIFNKLGADNRAQAVAIAAERHLV